MEGVEQTRMQIHGGRHRGAYGGYYTQDELRDLVKYAAERGITIVPEIEMPGHSAEVLTASPGALLHTRALQADGRSARAAWLHTTSSRTY